MDRSGFDVTAFVDRRRFRFGSIEPAWKTECELRETGESLTTEAVFCFYFESRIGIKDELPVAPFSQFDLT